MSIIREVATFDAGYSRNGVIALCSEIECHVCGAVNARGLSIDSSESEYGSGDVCLACLEALVAELKAVTS